jgi:hypothetical protein
LIVPERGLRAFARFLRRYHEASMGFVPPAGGRWAFGSGAAGPGQVICHGDFGPWNVVWRNAEPVGIVDFDFAGPGGPLLDVAYALEYATPFCSDEEARRWRAHSSSPDRPRRLEVFADAYGLGSTDGLVDAYGLGSTDGLVDAVIARQQLDVERVRQLADAGVEPQLSWVNDGVLTDLNGKVAWTRRHRASFMSAGAIQESPGTPRFASGFSSPSPSPSPSP